MVRFLFGAEVNYLHEILYAKLLLMNVSSISSTSQSSHGSKIATVSCKELHINELVVEQTLDESQSQYGRQIYSLKRHILIQTSMKK